MKIEFFYGFSPQLNPNIKWSKNELKSDEIIYSSGSLMIGYDSVSKKQRYFKGHDNNIKCLDLSVDGNYLITC
jgi:hypothetical protein